jgi:asparagine N-glycosylation enzyme membrane subunit Stt3
MTAKHKRSSRRRASAKVPGGADKRFKPQPASQKGTSARKGARDRRAALRAFLNSDNKRFVILCLLLISGFAFLVRCLHLFDSGHFYIISADSHVFHWMADEIMDNQPIPDRFPSGLAYPLAYLAAAVGFVFRMSDGDALSFVSRYLPPFLGVITALVIYMAVSRLCDRRVGLMSAFAWALLPHAYFIQGAGYLDRDGLNVLLIAIGAFAFVMSRRWHLRVRGRDVGWVLGALVVLAMELILYLEWSWVGPALLLAITIAYFAADLLVKSLEYDAYSPAARYQMASQRLSTRIKSALRESSWRPFALVISLNFLVALINLGRTSSTISFIRGVFAAGSGEIAELQGLTLGDMLLFQFFLLLIPIGMFLALMRRREGDILCLSWFVAFFILAFFSRRTILYATPAAAMLGGLVLGNLLDFRYSRQLGRTIQKIVAVIILGVLVTLSSLAYSLGSEQRVSANNAWYDALVYLRDNTEDDAIVMTWWDYGYWILDVAERRPVADGGLFGHGGYVDHDIGWAYCTADTSEAVEVMQKHKADYLVFSTVEMEILPVIVSHGMTMTEENVDLSNCLYGRAVFGNFQSEGGLERVYPGAEVANPDIVILALKEG